MSANDETQAPPPAPEPAANTDVGFPSVPGTADLPAELQDYPLQAGIVRQEEYSRLLPLVKWLLAIPHFFVLVFLGIGALFVHFIAFFAVLFTGRYPESLFNYMVGVLRWAWRVSAYVMLMVDPYPPFSLDDDPGYPARYEIAYPESVERWRPLVAWLLIIPYWFVASVLAYAASIVVFIAFFAILFTKRFPEGMFSFVEVTLRWSTRAGAYAYYLVTKYPPFAWG